MKLLQLILSKAKAVYAVSPVAVGLCAGYFGHGPISLACSVALVLLKGLLKL
jgi:hypothetical protein